jgi:hypothetical protein
MKTYRIVRLVLAISWGLGMTAKASPNSAEFDELISTLEQQPGLGSDDVARLEKASRFL